MILSGEAAIKKHIAEKKPLRVYFISGEEDFLSKTYADKLVAAVIQDKSGFCFFPFDEYSASFQSVYEACETLPVMSDRICVIIKNLNLPKLKSDEFESYLDYIPTLAPTTTLIFLFTGEIDMKAGSRYKKLSDACARSGAVFHLSRRTERDIAAALVRSAQKRGAKIDFSTAEYFILAAGNEMTNLTNEFNKLCAYAGSEQITRETVDLITVRSVQASVFDLAHAINSGSGDRAFEILSALIAEKTEATVIMGTLCAAYCDLYRAKLALDSSHSVRDIVGAFASYKNNDFRIKKILYAAKALDRRTVDAVIAALSETDMKIKTFSGDGYMLLEELTARLLLIMGARRAQA